MSMPLNLLPQSLAWQQLTYMQQVIWTQPDVALAVRAFHCSISWN
jgi:hypothetical protein